MVPPSPALALLLERQLHYVCGKGGVGKSAASVALALYFQRLGHNVLLAQVNAQDSHARLLGTTAIGPELREEARPRPGLGRLHVVNVTPAAAMKEYALMTLKFEALYHAVFENRLTRVFLRFVPSLAELTMQGKIWFHSEERDENTGRRRFDRIVVDCPSTGHGLRFLRVAQIIRDASRVGPMAEKTALMAQVMEDPARTALHVVALPEELPVTEARELVAEVHRRRTVPLGAAVLNQRLPRLFDDRAAAALTRVRGQTGALRDARDDESAGLDALLAVADRRQQRELLEQDQRGRLEELGLPTVELPLLFQAPLGRAESESLADAIAATVAAGERRP